MPGQDRTGPNGQGAMTGGGFGLCGAGTRTTPRMRQFLRRGYRRGGRGRGYRFFAGSGEGFDAPEKELVLSDLKQQASFLENTLKNIQSRISDLEQSQE